jgi:hypothetical protein
MILTFFVMGIVCWSAFMLDAHLVTKPPRHRSNFVMPSKEEENDLLYTSPHEWIRRARERLHDD